MRNNTYIIISTPIIIIVSVIYGLIVKNGFVGFGIDYYHAYAKSNVVASTIYDTVGWSLTTLSILDYHIGTFLTPFIISFASGILLKYFFKVNNLNSLLIFLIVFTFFLFSWPLVISSNNAMRQGLMMSFVFLSLVSFSNQKFILGFLLMTVAAVTHKSGVGFLFNLFYLIGYKLVYEKNFVINRKIIFLFGLLYFLLFLTICLTVTRYYGRFDTNKVISLDFRILNLIINFIYIVYFTYNFKLLKNYTYLFLYFFSFAAVAVISSGLNWEYERYNMVMIPAYIFAFTHCFAKNSKYIYLITVASILFILTLITGMYDLGVGVWSKDL